MMQHIHILFITKKLYDIQNYFWHGNVEKDSLYYISLIIIINCLN